MVKEEETKQDKEEKGPEDSQEDSPEDSPKDPKGPVDNSAPKARDPGPGADTDPGPQSGPAFPEPDFTTFMLSLSSSALMNLGLVNHPVTGKSEKDLPMAKHTIDILGMLKEKTSGNLTEDEAKLIENMLSELRLNYVKTTEKAPE